MIEIAIVDDESNVRLELLKKIECYFKGKSITYKVSDFSSGEEFAASSQLFDLIFLDIQMEGVSGMEVAKALRQSGAKNFIVFITILQEYVYEAFEVEASDYLLKPLDDVRFKRTMDRVCKNIQNTDTGSLAIPLRGNMCKYLYYKEIYYCEAINHKIEIHTRDATYQCYLKMEELSVQLDSRFFQCHRSYFVNLDYVFGYEDGQAVLNTGKKIPVSRLRGHDFSKAILCYMKGGKNHE